MSKQTSAPVSTNPSRGRIVAFVAVALGTLAGAACEDKAVGRPCHLSEEVTAVQGAYTVEASDCPSRICVKPGVQPGVPTDLDTVAYCTDQCKTDDECNGQTRDTSNKNDKRCRRGYTCAPIFGEGALCCKKLCLCRDFYSASVGPAVPDQCKPESDQKCSS